MNEGHEGNEILHQVPCWFNNLQVQHQANMQLRTAEAQNH